MNFVNPHQGKPPLGSTFRVDLLHQAALHQAEQLAHANPLYSAIVYCGETPESPDVLSGRASPLTYYVRLNNEPAPKHARPVAAVKHLDGTTAAHEEPCSAVEVSVAFQGAQR
jgi:hypothetical protein